MHKLASISVIVGLGAMSLTACGGSDSGGESTQGFCDSLLRLDESGTNPDEDFDGAIASLEDLKSNAPGDLKGDLDNFIDVMKRVNDAPEDADFADFEEDLETMTTSIENIEQFADENCEGLPDDIFD